MSPQIKVLLVSVPQEFVLIDNAQFEQIVLIIIHS